jgi:cobalt transporter subunit CbtB
MTGGKGSRCEEGSQALDIQRRETEMTQTLTTVKDQGWILMGLVLISLFSLYVLALDQGWLLSWFQGAQAFDLNFIHELVHDTRHAAGFPCH